MHMHHSRHGIKELRADRRWHYIAHNYRLKSSAEAAAAADPARAGAYVHLSQQYIYPTAWSLTVKNICSGWSKGSSTTNTYTIQSDQKREAGFHLGKSARRHRKKMRLPSPSDCLGRSRVGVGADSLAAYTVV